MHFIFIYLDFTGVYLIFYVIFFQKRIDMALEDTISLQIALLSLAQKVYPDRIDYVDKVLGTTTQILESLEMNKLVTRIMKSLI